MKKLFFLLIILLSAVSEARNRETGFYASLGAGYDNLTIKNASHESTYDGWSPAIGAGGMLSLGQTSVLFAGIEMKDLRVKNKSDSSEFIETLDGTSLAGRLGLEFGKIGFGAIATQDHFKVRQVTAGGASVETKLNGDGLGYFVSYSLLPEGDYKLGFEATYLDGEANDNYQYSTLSLAMKLSIFF